MPPIAATLVAAATAAAGTAPAGSPTLLIAGAALAALAVVLFGLEFFVPSGGLLALGCGVCVLLSVGAFYLHDPLWGVTAFLAYSVLAPFALVFGLRVWSNSPIARRLILGAEDDLDPDDDEAVARQAERRAVQRSPLVALVGLHGTAVTSLRPSGFITINGQRLDAVAEGDLIDAGTPVEVIDVAEGQLRVRPAPPPSSSSSPSS